MSARKYRLPYWFFALIPALLFSCVGSSSDISFNADGSGTVVQEFRIARELEELGQLDGNEGQPPLPVLQSDLEKTIARIPGLELKSYKTREDGADRVHRAEIAFDSPEALSGWFSGNGQDFTIDFPGKRITIVLSEPEEPETDESFREMMREELSGYTFGISFSLPGTGAYTWLDQDRNPLPPQAVPGTCSVSGNTAAWSVPMADLVYLENSPSLEISW